MKKSVVLLGSMLLISIATTSFAAEETMMMQHASALENVTAGKTIRGIVTPDTATGKASAHYAEGEFVLHAEFTGLATPQGDDFYEGWAVQRTPFKFISTGELTMKDGKYVNHFTSDTDYSSYDFYVLTLEPNDGDSAPADHIFEWEVAMKAMMMKENDTMMKETMMKDDTAMMEKKAAMMAKRDAVKAKIQAKVKKLSQKKIDTILQRVEALRIKLETLNISAEKKASYNETLDIFVEVLESGEMMIEKEETMMQK